MSIGTRIKERREELGYTQTELAKKIGISKGSIGNYESGISSPNENILIKLFTILKCDANYLYQDEIKSMNAETLSESEKKHIKKYRAVDLYAKRIVDTILDIELERIKSLHNDEPEEDTETFKIPLYDDKAAAGSGYMFNDNGYEMITVKRSRDTERADFVVIVSGASMEPEYYDGDKVLIHAQPDVYEGEIGLFTINDKGYIKKKGSDRLISLNPKYADIFLSKHDNFVCNGKVVGKLDEKDIID